MPVLAAKTVDSRRCGGDSWDTIEAKRRGVWRPVSTTLHLGRCWWIPGSFIEALVLDAVHDSVRDHPRLLFKSRDEALLIRYHTIRYLVRHDGLLTDAAGHIFVPDDPPHLRARLLAIAHAGAAGHRGQQATEQDLKARFVWPHLGAQVREFVSKCLLCCKTRGGK